MNSPNFPGPPPNPVGPPPGSSSPRKPVIGKPMMIALILVAVLAIVTVIVVINKNGQDDPLPDAASTSADIPLDAGTDSPGQGSSSDEPSTDSDPPESDGAVVESSLGISYEYPKNGPYFNPAKWGGPADLDIGATPGHDIVTYDACDPVSGSDFVVGVVASDESDLKTAAESTRDALADEIWTEPVTVSDTDLDSAKTNEQIPGWLATATLTLGEPEVCGTTESRLGAFAIKNADDETVVVFVSWRRDGDTDVTNEDMTDAAVNVLLSVKHI